MHYYRYTQLAAAYGQGNYGSNVYNAQSTSGAGGNSTPASSQSSALTNTGFDIALIVIIACLITFVALLVRFWKRPAKKPARPTLSETHEDQ